MYPVPLREFPQKYPTIKLLRSQSLPSEHYAQGNKNLSLIHMMIIYYQWEIPILLRCIYTYVYIYIYTYIYINFPSPFDEKMQMKLHKIAALPQNV